MSHRIKTLALLWGLACLGVGALAAGGSGLLMPFSDDWQTGLALMVPMLAGLGGGGLVTYAAVRSLGHTFAGSAAGAGAEAEPAGARPIPALKLPPAWALAGAFVLALAAGLGLWQADISRSFLMPLLVTIAAVLAPLAVAAWVLQSTPGGVPAWRGLAALGLGGTAGVVLAIVLSLALSGAVMVLVFGLAEPAVDLLGSIVDLLTGGLFGGRWATVELIATLLEVAVLVPLVEELAKPLALLPVLKRLPHARDALLLGVLAGAGFAAVEDLLYAALFGEQWGGVLATRTLGAALHPFGAGLMAVAWWGVLRREPDAGKHWLRNYALACGAHGVWNSTSVVTAALGSARFQFWQVTLLGVAESAVLLALLAVEGLGLLLALRAIARRLAPAADAAPSAGQVPTERAIAVWAVVCLVVLVPVGLGLLRTL